MNQQAIKDALEAYVAWQAAGFPVGDPYDTYPGDHYHAACRPEAIRALLAELEEAKRGADRYETVRRLNPQAFLDAYILNQRTNKPFDEIIDDLKPFVRPAAAIGKEQSK